MSYAEEVGAILVEGLAPLTAGEFGILADAARRIHVERLAVEVGPEGAEEIQQIIDSYLDMEALTRGAVVDLEMPANLAPPAPRTEPRSCQGQKLKTSQRSRTVKLPLRSEAECDLVQEVERETPTVESDYLGQCFDTANPAESNPTNGLSLSTHHSQTKEVGMRLHNFADNLTIQPQSEGYDPILVSVDGSLDEGDNVICTATTPSILSNGVEYFIQVDRDTVALLTTLVDMQIMDDPSYASEYLGLDVDTLEDRARGLLAMLSRVDQYLDGAKEAS